MNPLALLFGAARVLRTARAVLGAGAEEQPGEANAAPDAAAVDYAFECARALAPAQRCDSTPSRAEASRRRCSARRPGEAELARAWEIFVAARAVADTASGEAKSAALDAFLATFVAHAAAWAPAEPGALHATPTPSLSAVLQAPRGCASGHPQALLLALADATSHSAAALGRGARLYALLRGCAAARAPGA
jgi:hypothetical protein